MNIPRVGLLGAGIAAILFAVGCGGGQAGPTPDAEATLKARVELAEASLSDPTTAPLPTHTPPPTHTTAPTHTPPPTYAPLPIQAPLPTPAPQVVIKEVVKQVPVEAAVSKAVEKIVEVEATATPSPVPTATPSPTPIPAPIFWNRAKVGQDGEPFPSCGDSIFTHHVVDPENATPFFWVEDVYPHEHMIYWATPRLNEEGFQPGGVPNTEQVQLYAPADIYRMQVWRIVRESGDGGTYEEWKNLTVICEGYSMFWSHLGKPPEEILVEVRKSVPVSWSDCPVSTTEEALVTTEVGSCVWRVFFDPPISAGTPIWKSSGYTTGFDLGFQLLGLTAEELRQHPSYGYAINPWAYSGGTSVCTLEYFPEPYRTSYLETMEGSCGPVNQDVPGTAMGVWLPVPPPADGSVPDRGPGTVWQSLGVGGNGLVLGLYLFEDHVDKSVHKLHSGSQLPGVPAGKYRIETVSDGLVNREWDSVVPGEVYCAELRRQWAVSGWDDTVTELVLVEVSEDGRTLTIEGITGTKCPEGRYSFSPDAHTMYR